jgi:hypothetical protein
MRLPRAPQGAPDDERGFAAGTDLERAGDWGAQLLRAPQHDVEIRVNRTLYLIW